MFPENRIQGRHLLVRRSAGNILIGGLGTLAGCGPKSTILCPPNTKSRKRASKPYKHRGEGRRVLGTSKDVMPAMAGYTSTPCDHVNHEENGGAYERL